MTHILPVGPSFRLAAIPKLGQDFRWRRWKDCWYSVVLRGNLIRVHQNTLGLEYLADSNQNALLCSYFRLKDPNPIDDIYAKLSHDEKIGELVGKHHPGVRLLRQDRWECMIAYICSANNSVACISGIVEKIAEAIGQPVELNGEVRFAFPTAEMVIEAGEGSLEELGLGLPRLPSDIISAAKRICASDPSLEELACLPYTDAIKQLKEQFDGIGNKVANCIALFALDKTEAFPVDRHIGRALAKWYPGCPIPEDLSKLTQDKPNRDVVEWAQDRFGQYAGYANQLLFHEQRLGATPTRHSTQSLKLV